MLYAVRSSTAVPGIFFQVPAARGRARGGGIGDPRLEIFHPTYIDMVQQTAVPGASHELVRETTTAVQQYVL